MRWPTPSPAHAASPSAISAGVPRSAGESDDARCGARRLGELDVDTDRDLDAPPDRGRPPRIARCNSARTRARAVVRLAEPGQVPGISVASGQPQHPRPLRGDEDRHVRPGRREEDGVVEPLDPAAVEVGPARRGSSPVMTVSASSNRPTLWSVG